MIDLSHILTQRRTGEEKMNEKTRTMLGGGLLAVFSAMIALGAARGEIAAVMAKACAICLQCIGIG